MTSILVAGPLHSGVPTLYSAIKTVMPRGLSVFGPRQPQQFEFIRDQPHVWKLAAVTVPSAELDSCDLGFFDRVVLLRRDARDRLVSAVLSGVCEADACDDDDFIEHLLDEFRLKERDPAGVSIRRLVEAYETHGHRVQVGGEPSQQQASISGHRNAVTVAYESVLRHDVSDLESYLGLRLPEHWTTPQRLTCADCEPPPEAWRHWFTRDDVDHYRPELGAVLSAEGYEDEWTLAAQPCFNPGLGSELVDSAVTRLRSFPNTHDTLRDRSFYTEAYAEHLRGAIGDGSEGAMIEYALAHLVGYLARPAKDEYLRWMHAARRRRSPSALVHWGVALERLVASDRSFGPEHYFAEAAAMIGNAATKRRTAKVRALYEAHHVGATR